MTHRRGHALFGDGATCRPDAQPGQAVRGRDKESETTPTPTPAIRDAYGCKRIGGEHLAAGAQQIQRVRSCGRYVHRRGLLIHRAERHGAGGHYRAADIECADRLLARAAPAVRRRITKAS